MDNNIVGVDKIVKPSKRLLSLLADFFLTFVVASGIYSVLVYPLMKRLPSYKNSVTAQETYMDECRDMYVSGKLMKYDTDPNDYLLESIKGKLADDNNDIFVYYYTNYLPTLHKKSEAYNYSVVYVNKTVYQYENQGELILFDLDGDLSHPLKVNENAKAKINQYLSGDVTKENESYYSKLNKLYKDGFVDAEAILTNSDEYLARYQKIINLNNVLFLWASVSSLITYTVFFIVFYVVMPLIFKNGQTIGKKICKIGLYHDTIHTIRNNILILRAVLQYITYYFMVMFIPVWQIGTSIINLPALIIGPVNINLFILAFFSLAIALISFVYMVMREDKQALHDKVVGVYAYRMDVQLEEENIIKNEEILGKGDSSSGS